MAVKKRIDTTHPDYLHDPRVLIEEELIRRVPLVECGSVAVRMG